MTELLNNYKDFLEVDLITRRGSAFIKRQKGQLKLDNSVIEEFFSSSGYGQGSYGFALF